MPVDPNKQVQDMMASDSSLVETIAAIRDKRKPLPNVRNRNFDHLEQRDHDTRKLLSVKGRKVRNERDLRVAAEAIQRINENENRKIKRDKPINSRFHHSGTKSTIFGTLD